MNNQSTLLKLVVAFLLILLGLQLFSFFRKASPAPTLKEIRKEMERIDSLNQTLQGGLNKINQRTSLVDQLLADELQKYQQKIDQIHAEIQGMRARSGQLQGRVDTLLRQIKITGAPNHLPTLNELKLSKTNP